ncbi:hypothetical protein M3M33_13785, partial [Loigolactobacillus coryniformis]|uniref:hypothetical protein n=1 Tax=Loigolactobacillus coryniformis TaxID=1610 RepID=UPI00201B2098
IADSGNTKQYFNVNPLGVNSIGPFNFGGTSPDWFYNENTTAATGGAPAQLTHDYISIARVWDGAASRKYGWIISGLPATTGASYTSDLWISL